MKRGFSVAAVVFAACFSVTAFAGSENCKKPEQLDIPDGDNASEQELVATQKKVKEYVAEGEAYLECNDAKREKLLEDYNTTVDEMKETSETFNKSVKAFKSAN